MFCINVSAGKKEEEIVMSIRIGILGYGNLGRGVECAIKHNPDTELVAVFTRRDPETVKILTETAKGLFCKRRREAER